MSRPRILNLEPAGYSRSAAAILSEFGELVEAERSREELLAEIGEYDALIVRFAHRIDAELLARATRLRAIGSATTGLDHIDVAAAEQRDIRVLCLRGERDFLETIPATAEHSWALLLALTRRIPSAVDQVTRGGWDRDALRGHDLRGRSLGIIGFGRVGSQVARFAQAFGMQVRSFDPELAKAAPGVEPVSLDELLASCDVISVHVPGGPETAGLLGPREFAGFKPGALLINTSRGSVLDESALIQALESGRLAGAALDVLRDENAAGSNHPLIQYARDHENLLITPHIAGASVESMQRTEVFIAEKMRDFFAESDAC